MGLKRGINPKSCCFFLLWVVTWFILSSFWKRVGLESRTMPEMSQRKWFCLHREDFNYEVTCRPDWGSGRMQCWPDWCRAVTLFKIQSTLVLPRVCLKALQPRPTPVSLSSEKSGSSCCFGIDSKSIWEARTRSESTDSTRFCKTFVFFTECSPVLIVVTFFQFFTPKLRCLQIQSFLVLSCVSMPCIMW